MNCGVLCNEKFPCGNMTFRMNCGDPDKKDYLVETHVKLTSYIFFICTCLLFQFANHLDISQLTQQWCMLSAKCLKDLTAEDMNELKYLL